MVYYYNACIAFQRHTTRWQATSYPHLYVVDIAKLANSLWLVRILLGFAFPDSPFALLTTHLLAARWLQQAFCVFSQHVFKVHLGTLGYHRR